MIEALEPPELPASSSIELRCPHCRALILRYTPTLAVTGPTIETRCRRCRRDVTAVLRPFEPAATVRPE